MCEENGDEFVEVLLDWYVENGRHDLPWRDPDVSAFEVLVAELMLQQTSAGQVRGVYDEFVERHPTAGALLAAPEEDVAELIEPLGLRKRTAYFRRASAQLLARHDGRVPDSRSELLELHGVGEYTAASVLAHAYGRDASAVDTNVARVLARIFGLGSAGPEATETWELAERLDPLIHLLRLAFSGIDTQKTRRLTFQPLSEHRLIETMVSLQSR